MEFKLRESGTGFERGTKGSSSAPEYQICGDIYISDCSDIAVVFCLGNELAQQKTHEEIESSIPFTIIERSLKNITARFGEDIDVFVSVYLDDKEQISFTVDNDFVQKGYRIDTFRSTHHYDLVSANFEVLKSGQLYECLQLTFKGTLHPSYQSEYYIEKLQSSGKKEERLKLFRRISNFAPLKQRQIARKTRDIDLSGIALDLLDINAMASIITQSTHLDSVNFKACKLVRGSLQNLSRRVKSDVKIDKFRVDGNPDLRVDDLIAGVDLCARVGAAFVYDPEYLSASEQQKFMDHCRTYQLKDVMKDSKTRKSLVKEERFQRMYKKTSSSERGQQRLVLRFPSKPEKRFGVESAERGDEDSEHGGSSQFKDMSSNSNASSNERELQRDLLDFNSNSERQFDVESAEGGKEDKEMNMTPRSSVSAEARDSSQILSTSEDNVAKNNPEQIETKKRSVELLGEKSSSHARKKIRPQNLNEHMKMKPLLKFEKMMKSISSGGMSFESGSRATLARMRKTMAMNSDRRRFEFVAFEKFGSNLRSYMRNTQLEVCTRIVRSEKGDSGYKTRSSFSEVLSSKSNLRRYSRKSEQDTKIMRSLQSTQAGSLEKLEEVDTSTEKSGSSNSGISPRTAKLHQKNEHNQNRLIEQKFEMTVLGLGAIQSRREQVLCWMDNAHFDVVPTDLDEFTRKLSTLVIDEEHQQIDECAKRVSTLAMSGGYYIANELPEKMPSKASIAEGMNRDLEQSEIEPESEEFYSDFLDEESSSDDLSSIEDIVGDIMEELLWQLVQIDTRTNDLTASEYESGKDYVRRIAVELELTCKRKAFKTRQIHPGGGSMELDGYELIFPPGAVEKVTYIRISVDNNPKKFPKFGIAISAILSCHPSKFKVPVLVRLTTWLSAKPGKKILVTIMSSPDSAASWKEIRTLALSEQNVVEYQTSSFCGHIATTTNEGVNDGKHHLTNDAWIHKRTAYLVSLFCKDKKALKDQARMLKRDHSHAISVPVELLVSIGDTVAVEVECNRPPPPAMTIASMDGTDGRLKIDESVLNKSRFSLSFEPVPHPNNMQNDIQYRVLYHNKLLDSEGQPISGGEFTSPLHFYWPMTSKRSSRDETTAHSSRSDSHHISVPGVQAHGNVYIGGQGHYIDHSNPQDEATPPKRPAIENKED